VGGEGGCIVGGHHIRKARMPTFSRAHTNSNLQPQPQPQPQPPTHLHHHRREEIIEPPHVAQPPADQHKRPPRTRHRARTGAALAEARVQLAGAHRDQHDPHQHHHQHGEAALGCRGLGWGLCGCDWFDWLVVGGGRWGWVSSLSLVTTQPS